MYVRTYASVRNARARENRTDGRVRERFRRTREAHYDLNTGREARRKKRERDSTRYNCPYCFFYFPILIYFPFCLYFCRHRNSGIHILRDILFRVTPTL